jgi:hypothetical protein
LDSLSLGASEPDAWLRQISGSILMKRALLLLPRLALPLAAVIFTTGFSFGPRLTGTWTGSGTETVCGAKVTQPIAVTLSLKQTQAPYDPALVVCRKSNPLIGGHRNVEGKISEVGGFKTPSETGPFVGCFDKDGNLSGLMLRQNESGSQSLKGVAKFQMPWIFEIELKAEGGFLSYDKLSGTVTRSWNCPVSPGSLITKPGSDVISVVLSRRR